MSAGRSLTVFRNLPIIFCDGAMKTPVAGKNSGMQYAKNQYVLYITLP